MPWNIEALAEVPRAFPELSLSETGVLSGTLTVRGIMVAGSLALNPKEDLLAEDGVAATYILDRYPIVIWHDDGGPKLRIPSPRFQRIADDRSVKLIDLHLDDDLTACWASDQEVELVSGPPTSFVENYALPFLYSQAHYERHGNWPWPDLEHGFIGILEWLGRRKSVTLGDLLLTQRAILKQYRESAWRVLNQRARPYGPCPCSSSARSRLRDCHRDIKPAVDALRGAMSQGVLPELREFMLSHRRDAAKRFDALRRQ